jgi:hypothetical protein
VSTGSRQSEQIRPLKIGGSAPSGLKSVRYITRFFVHRLEEHTFLNALAD